MASFTRYRFGVFEFDAETPELRKSGRPVRLRPQGLKLLKLLISRPREVIAREEMARFLWDAGVFVDFEQGLNHTIKQVRAALGDDAESPRYVETLPRRGYRFIAPVEAVVASKEAAVRADVTEPQGPIELRQERIQRSELPRSLANDSSWGPTRARRSPSPLRCVSSGGWRDTASRSPSSHVRCCRFWASDGGRCFGRPLRPAPEHPWRYCHSTQSVRAASILLTALRQHSRPSLERCRPAGDCVEHGVLIPSQATLA